MFPKRLGSKPQEVGAGWVSVVDAYGGYRDFSAGGTRPLTLIHAPNAVSALRFE